MKTLKKFKLNFGLNISIKLNKILMNSVVVFFRLHGPFQASFYEITFGRWSLGGKRETRLATW